MRPYIYYIPLVFLILILPSKANSQKVKLDSVQFFKKQDYSPNGVMSQMADSINQYEKTKEAPLFLFNKCLDWDIFYWPSFHSPTSVRWEILRKVHNRRSLEQLLSRYKIELQSICTRIYNGPKGYPGDLTPPENQFSTYQLLSRRLMQLKEK